mmetsp:Transcript_26228/g.60945  ORF Transcript_26228/g.60945 Transcript_26228/m.60945 type:complete len:84 (+) Transcript_26228:111-362(+)
MPESAAHFDCILKASSNVTATSDTSCPNILAGYGRTVQQIWMVLSRVLSKYAVHSPRSLFDSRTCSFESSMRMDPSKCHFVTF